MFVQRRKKIDAGIDMTPLIDVVFQLLIFLMVSSQFTKPPKMVDLPTGYGEATPYSQKEKKHILALKSDNTILLNDQPVTVETLSNTLKALFATSPNKKVELHGDKEADLGTFIKVYDITKLAGAEKITYLKKISE